MRRREFFGAAIGLPLAAASAAKADDRLYVEIVKNESVNVKQTRTIECRTFKSGDVAGVFAVDPKKVG